MRAFAKVVIVLALLAAAASPAYAYIDPGTGSLVLQIVLGGLAGLLVGWRFLRHKVRELFTRAKKE